METRMSIVTFLCLLTFGLAKATSVHITQEWKQNVGWEVTCHWTLESNDTLQSVALSRNKQQFFSFRPEDFKGALSHTASYTPEGTQVTVDLQATTEKGIKGRCKLTIEPIVAPEHDLVIGCAVSGERPFFKIAEAEETVQALISPSEPTMIVTSPESGPPTINCTTSGIPTPRILWTVDNQTVPHNFHNSAWNATSKLWDAWSTFTPLTEGAKVLCTPEVVRGSRQIRGQSVQYNNALRIGFDGLLLAVATISSIVYKTL